MESRDGNKHDITQSPSLTSSRHFFLPFWMWFGESYEKKKEEKK
jgi:hypothetical protein